MYLEIVRKNICGEMLNYFEGHFPRFDYQLDIFQKLLETKEIKNVLNIGTGFPFTSGLFSFEKIPVRYGMLGKETFPILNNFCFPLEININHHPDLEKADLVICTECLEHLPSSMIKARDWLANIATKYLFLSFPLGGKNAQDYGKENLGDYEQVSHPHIREFTQLTAEDFIKDLPFAIIEEKEIFTRAYGGIIWNVLLERDENDGR